jgi:hypothetical protein
MRTTCQKSIKLSIDFSVSPSPLSTNATCLKLQLSRYLSPGRMTSQWLQPISSPRYNCTLQVFFSILSSRAQSGDCQLSVSQTFLTTSTMQTGPTWHFSDFGEQHADMAITCASSHYYRARNSFSSISFKFSILVIKELSACGWGSGGGYGAGGQKEEHCFQ